MIRVCFTVDAPFLGGAERYVAYLARGLDRSRFAPSVLMAEPGPGAEALEQWSRELEDAGVRVHRVPMHLPFRPLGAAGVLRAFSALAPDVVHVNMPGPYDGQMGLLAPLGRLAGCRGVVTTEHLPMVERLWKRAAVKRFSLRFVDVVVTVSRANVPYVVERQGVRADRVRVVRNGLPSSFGAGAPGRADARRALGLPADGVHVLFVGNLLPHKGLSLLVEALLEVSEEDWRLIVVGDGPDGEPCRRRLESAGAAGRACFLGRRRAADVEAALAAADLLALPSSQEGLPYVILEAMASARAVVATRVFGIPEMIDDGVHGILVAPGDVEELAAALRRMIGDAPARERMGAAGRARFLAEFTLERQLDTMAALYETLARRAGGGR